ncbi:DET1- and DDB1-associated protein 1 [Copidosoma floridanum]|uniref:DET1- and DDB1-associated protein 1 n=1 Tax=Copidosoma floridanum TaxID=29053 RepID=UPI0006C99587|nr:DET1- and DDB1-associated protein 1 [Copidosoma floridanum]
MVLNGASESSKTSVAEFLSGLPSINENNFANFHTDNANRTCIKRPSVYLPTKDYPSEQVIVTETKTIILKYLHQKWDKNLANNGRKRDLLSTNGDSPEEGRKRPRLDISNTI